MTVGHGIAYEPIPLPDRQALSSSEQLAAAMAFHAQMRRRHSVRDFSAKPVAREVIEACIRTAGTAPSGANHQPWFFAAVASPALKSQIRAAAEAEERTFYAGGAGEEWLRALESVGTGVSKPHLEIAPWLIVVFAQRWSENSDGTRRKNYYVPESVGIAAGFLLAALHHAGLATLTHTPNPMGFLNRLLGRPNSEKPIMIVVAGHPADNAMVPRAALTKKPQHEISSVHA